MRYHHVGPLAPMSCWDRWEGAVFIDPGITGEQNAVSLYEVAVRHADISLLSSTAGLLDQREGVDWVPTDLADLLDCPVVVVVDCRGWGTGIKVLTKGIKAYLKSVNLVGVILSGVADNEQYELLKRVMAEEDIRVAGCLYEGQGSGLGCETTRPVGAAPVRGTTGECSQAGRCWRAGQTRRSARLLIHAHPFVRPQWRGPVGHGSWWGRLHSLEPRLSRSAAFRRGAGPSPRPAQRLTVATGGVWLGDRGDVVA